jgi:hypothetical protein
MIAFLFNINYFYMMNSLKLLIPLFLCAILLSACAGGPTKDYYNPQIIGAHFQGPVTIIQADHLNAELEKCHDEGYQIIGVTRYSGSYPKTVELVAQARRVGANHVVYHSGYLAPEPGSWHFSISSWGGNGGTDGGKSDNYIVFLGK